MLIIETDISEMTISVAKIILFSRNTKTKRIFFHHPSFLLYLLFPTFIFYLKFYIIITY